MPTIYLAKCVLVIRTDMQEYNSNLYYTTMDDTSPNNMQEKGPLFSRPLEAIKMSVLADEQG